MHNELYSNSTELAYRDRITSSVGNTSRGIHTYANELALPTERFIKRYLAEKVVVDMGSGNDALALDAALRGINTTIFSVNPCRKDRIYNNVRDIMIYNAHNQYLEYCYSHDQITTALAVVDQHAICAFGQELPMIEDNSVDTILDMYAVSLYTTELDEVGIYTQYLKECMRILKPGGQMRIIDPLTQWWKSRAMQQLELNYKPIRRYPSRPIMQGKFHSVSITKAR